MPAYKDTYLVWCYMVQMMHGGMLIYNRDSEAWRTHSDLSYHTSLWSITYN